MSPSCTTYVFPSCLYLPAALTADSLPNSFRSSNFITSAHMKPLSKSE
uniref:GTP-binding protein PTD004 n=1 Tax=Arundo donax TaxID=35708 RepID=A0A0A9CY24_ARUDO